MKARHYLPLLGFVVPTVVIGYGVVIPRSCIAGINELTIGFATTVVGACATYIPGRTRGPPRSAAVAAVRRPAFIARQSSHPRGLLGWIIGRIMSVETATTNEKALELLELREGDRVLEVGFGHGRTVERAASMVGAGLVVGLDASEQMVRMASRRCQHLIDAGRVRLVLGDSAGIPYPDESFDKVYAVHTIYFWDDPKRHLREMCRVLRPGGYIVVGFHMKEAAVAASFPASVYSFYGVHEVHEMLRYAGIAELSVPHIVGEVALVSGRRGSSMGQIFRD